MTVSAVTREISSHSFLSQRVCDFFDATTNRYRVPYQFMQFLSAVATASNMTKYIQQFSLIASKMHRRVEIEMLHANAASALKSAQR